MIALWRQHTRILYSSIVQVFLTKKKIAYYKSKHKTIYNQPVNQQILQCLDQML